MWGGIALTIGCVGLRVASRGVRRAARRLIPCLLACVLLLLAWTAHQGGSLTHGNNYLTEYLPGPLKRLALGTVQAKTFAYPDSFYAKHIYPIFDANCVACHGRAKGQRQSSP